MKKYALVALLTMLLATILPGAMIMADQHEAAIEDVENYTCKQIMILDGHDRETAISFLHGYLIGKASSSKFNPDQKGEQTISSSTTAWIIPAQRPLTY
jgi:hypothetical protein